MKNSIVISKEEQEEARKDGKLEMVSSVNEYVPPPFRETNWEIIGNRVVYGDFAPLEVAILPNDSAEPDPMFEDFGGRISTGLERGFHLPGDWGSASGEEEQPAFDPALLQAEMEKAFADGKQAGYAEGYEAAKQEIAEHYQVLSAQLQDFNELIRTELLAHRQRLEEQAFTLALNVSRKILTTTAEAKPEYILQVIRNGLHMLGAAKPIRIRVSPDDMEFLEVIGVPPELSSTELGVEYVIDDTVKSGCIIETDFGEVDLQLDKMWDQVKADLFEVTR